MGRSASQDVLIRRRGGDLSRTRLGCWTKTRTGSLAWVRWPSACAGGCTGAAVRLILGGPELTVSESFAPVLGLWRNPADGGRGLHAVPRDFRLSVSGTSLGRSSLEQGMVFGFRGMSEGEGSGDGIGDGAVCRSVSTCEERSCTADDIPSSQR